MVGNDDKVTKRCEAVFRILNYWKDQVNTLTQNQKSEIVVSTKENVADFFSRNKRQIQSYLVNVLCIDTHKKTHFSTKVITKTCLQTSHWDHFRASIYKNFLLRDTQNSIRTSLLVVKMYNFSAEEYQGHRHFRKRYSFFKEISSRHQIHSHFTPRLRNWT